MFLVDEEKVRKNPYKQFRINLEKGQAVSDLLAEVEKQVQEEIKVDHMLVTNFNDRAGNIESILPYSSSC